MSEVKTLYKITWKYQKTLKNGNTTEVEDCTTIRRTSLITAIQEVCEYLEVKEQEIIRIEVLDN